MVIGEPLDFSRYAGMADDRFVQRSVTDEIMYALMRLSGQEYVDVYAQTVKTQLAAAKKQAKAEHSKAAHAKAGQAKTGKAQSEHPQPDAAVPEDGQDAGAAS